MIDFVRSSSSRSPFWILLAAVWGITLSSLTFALLSIFHWIPVSLTGFALTVVMVRLMPAGFCKPISRTTWRVAVLVALASAVLNGLSPSEEFVTGRDAGTYLATAGWLAGNGTLMVDVDAEQWRDIDGLVFEVPGFSAVNGGGTLQPQFLHAFPSVAATVYQIGGVQAALRLNAVLGGVALLCLFAFASLLIRPWLALVVEVALSVNLVFAYFSRASLSEIMALLFVFGGLTLLWHGQSELSGASGLAAGLVLGSTLVVRIDALVLLMPILGFALVRRRDPDESVFWGGVLLGVLFMAAIALADLVAVGQTYLRVVRTPVMAALVGLAAVVAISLLLSKDLRILRGFVNHNRKPLARLAFGAILVGGVFLVAFRPHLSPATGNPYGLALIQEQEGLRVEPDRTYAELAGWWLWWYLGPVVVLGVCGWALVAFRQIKRPDMRILPFLLVFSTYCVLYVSRPSINPDQIWAMRRFLPVVIPGLLIFAAWLADQISHHGSGRSSASAVAGMAFIMIIGPLGTLLPVLDLHEYKGFASDFMNACGQLGDDAVVVVLDDQGRLGEAMIQSFRSFCDIPTAMLPHENDLDILANRWQEAGRSLWVVRWNNGTQPGLRLFDAEYQRLEKTLTRVPRAETAFPVFLIAEELP